MSYEVKNTHHSLQFKMYISCQCHLVSRESSCCFAHFLYRFHKMKFFLGPSGISRTSSFSAEIERRPRLKEQEIQSLAPRSC
jgi:hypothetical protein